MAAANRRCHPCANARCHQNADPNDGSNDGHLGRTDQITELVIGNTIEAAVHLQLWPDGKLARSANGSVQPLRDVYANRATVAKDLVRRDGRLGQWQQTNQLAHLIVTTGIYYSSLVGLHAHQGRQTWMKIGLLVPPESSVAKSRKTWAVLLAIPKLK